MTSGPLRCLTSGVLLAAIWAACSLAPSARASSYRLPEDHAIAAWDTRTGVTLWKYKPEKLSFAEFELRPGLLTVTPFIGYSGSPEINLDPRTGQVIGQAPPPMIRSIPLAKSDDETSRIAPLANGWTPNDFSPGQNQPLEFRDHAAHVRWRLHLTPEPEAVATWRDSVFSASGHTVGDAVVQRYSAGQAKPDWTFYPRQALGAPAESIHARLAILVADDDLYVCLREHLFLLDPRDAVVRKHWNLVEAAGVAWQRDGSGFYRGGIASPRLLSDQRTLIISFEGRVLAIDRDGGELRWHRDPDLGLRPVPQHPLLYGGVLFLTVGE